MRREARETMEQVRAAMGLKFAEAAAGVLAGA